MTPVEEGDKGAGEGTHLHVAVCRGPGSVHVHIIQQAEALSQLVNGNAGLQTGAYCWRHVGAEGQSGWMPQG